MPIRKWQLAIGLACTLACGSRPPAARGSSSAVLNARIIPVSSLLELSYQNSAFAYRSGFFDLALTVEFATAGGTVQRRAGFYAGGQTWKVRFRPDRPGRWTYTYSAEDRAGRRFQGTGSFDCVPNPAASEAPLVRDPEDIHRWVYPNGRPYFPVGLQDCVYLNDSGIAPFTIDGEGRQGPTRNVSVEQYFTIYGEAGFNLLRFSQRNCSYFLFRDLDHYNEAESNATDLLLSTARSHGFRIMFGIFGYHGQSHDGSLPGRILSFIRTRTGTLEEAVDDPGDVAVLQKEKRFIEYCVARWGEFVDFWELLNERKAKEDWTRTMAASLRSVDPLRKPISTSWEQPSLREIDFNAPHWYESEPACNSDLRVEQMARQWKAFGKPVLVGEQGNTGMNWDSESARRMRVRLWTALFEEIGLVFWNTSWSKSGMYQGRYTPGSAANIYLGPEERGYTRALHSFCSRLAAGLRPAPTDVISPPGVRAYVLRSPRQMAVYLHRCEGRAVPVRIRVPKGIAGEAEWIDPATGRTLAKRKLLARAESFDAPHFAVDAALLVTAPAR